MELQFNEENGYWVAEFSTDENVAVHISRIGSGSLVVQQKSMEDVEFVDTYRNVEGPEIDFDLTSLVYTKYWRIISSCEVISSQYKTSE